MMSIKDGQRALTSRTAAFRSDEALTTTANRWASGEGFGIEQPRSLAPPRILSLGVLMGCSSVQGKTCCKGEGESNYVHMLCIAQYMCNNKLLKVILILSYLKVILANFD